MGQELNIFNFIFLSSVEMPLLFQGIRRQKVQADQHVCTMLVQVLEMKGQACARNCTHAKNSDPANFLADFFRGVSQSNSAIFRQDSLITGMTRPVEISN